MIGTDTETFMEMTHPDSPGQHSRTTVRAFADYWALKGWTPWTGDERTDIAVAVAEEEIERQRALDQDNANRAAIAEATKNASKVSKEVANIVKTEI